MSRQKAKGNCFDQNSIAVYYKIEKYIKGLFILFPLLRILKISCYICVQYIYTFFWSVCATVHCVISVPKCCM